jgi:glycosidase
MLLEKGARQIGKAAALIMSWYYRYTHEQTHYCWNFLGNHDLPRLISVMHDKRQYKMAIALLYALPGIPLIYYGEEIALQGMNDPDNRRCMDWAEADFNNPGNPGTPLIMQCYQWLNKLRRKYSAIFGEGCIAIPYLDENNKILVLQRFTGEEALYFIFNFGEKKVTVNFSEFSKAYKFELKSLSFDCEHSLELETHICVDSSEVKFIYGRSHEGL